METLRDRMEADLKIGGYSASTHSRVSTREPRPRPALWRSDEPGGQPKRPLNRDERLDNSWHQSGNSGGGYPALVGKQQARAVALTWAGAELYAQVWRRADRVSRGLSTAVYAAVLAGDGR